MNFSLHSPGESGLLDCARQRMDILWLGRLQHQALISRYILGLYTQYHFKHSFQKVQCLGSISFCQGFVSSFLRFTEFLGIQRIFNFKKSLFLLKLDEPLIDKEVFIFHRLTCVLKKKMFASIFLIYCPLDSDPNQYQEHQLRIWDYNNYFHFFKLTSPLFFKIAFFPQF